MRIRRLRLVASLFVMAAAASLAAFMPAAHAQPPQTVLIQGQLLDDQGAAIVGLRQYRVRFYDAEVDGTQLGGDVSDVTQVNAQGLFAIALIPPAEVLSAPEAWYELAIDSGTPAVGVGPEDVFPARVRVHSVPFARVAGEALSIEVEAIGGGGVSAAEFNALAGITGSVQSQLDAKAEATAVNDALGALSDALDAKPELAEVLPRTGESFVVVQTAADPVQNGANLLAAYAQAAALTPHGEPLSASNRAVVIVLPGRYDLGTGQLEMNTEFVDLVGLSTARDDQYIVGASNGPGTGVLRQTADNVRIENLVVECTRDSGSIDLSVNDPAAYFPDSNLPSTVVRNCRFVANETLAWSTRVGEIDYAGFYFDVHGGRYAFGGNSGTASGSFTNCTGGDFSFGGAGGTASGDFLNCTGGANAFGGGSFSVASGTFTNCTGGNYAFGGGFDSVASGNFTNCTGAIGAFGGDGAASGFFNNCVGGNESFGAFGSAAGGRFYYCVGGVSAFTLSGSPTLLFCVQNDAPFP